MVFGAIFVLTLFHVCNAARLPSIRPKLNFTECGLANANLSPFARSYGGTTTTKNLYPWMLYIYLKREGRFDGYICGGTLISNEWILTAASCIASPDFPGKYGIILGEHRASRRSGVEKFLNVVEIVRHEEYMEHNLKNDIALLRLEEPVNFTHFVRPICLPDKDFPTDADEELYHKDDYITYAGKQCLVLAWGETETKWKSDVLKQKIVRIFPRVLCTVITYYAFGYNATVSTSDNRFCAGGDIGQDTCSTRPGGPLMCQDDDGKYHFHGITSFGPEPCGISLAPGVYTEVSAYRDWIDNNTV